MDTLPSPNTWSYWFGSYGRIGNRPIEEILRVAQPDLVPPHLRGHNGRRYAVNTANVAAGYVAGERAAWLASVNALLPAETDLAWHIELTLARAFRRLDDLQDSLSLDVHGAQALTATPT